MEFKHEHAKQVWLSDETDEKGYIQTTLNIETDLVSDPLDANYDVDLQNDLQHAAVEYSKVRDCRVQFWTRKPKNSNFVPDKENDDQA